METTILTLIYVGEQHRPGATLDEADCSCILPALTVISGECPIGIACLLMFSSVVTYCWGLMFE